MESKRPIPSRRDLDAPHLSKPWEPRRIGIIRDRSDPSPHFAAPSIFLENRIVPAGRSLPGPRIGRISMPTAIRRPRHRFATRQHPRVSHIATTVRIRAGGERRVLRFPRTSGRAVSVPRAAGRLSLENPELVFDGNSLVRASSETLRFARVAFRSLPPSKIPGPALARVPEKTKPKM
jgi:hypothetical protein